MKRKRLQFYFAGADTGGDHDIFTGFDNVAFLVSYWYVINGPGWDTIEYARKRGIPLFLDSGAFSALMSGVVIDLNDYIDFVAEHNSLFQVVASLDVIGDWQKTRDNHLMMTEAGLITIPTFHVNSPWEALISLLTENNYIALGVAGMQQRRNALIRWLVRCFQLRDEYNDICHIHGFALTSTKIMRSFPWYSVDSTSWISGRQYGKLLIKDGAHIYTTGRNDRRARRYRYLFPPRNGTRRDYEPALKHNIKTTLNWVYG